MSQAHTAWHNGSHVSIGRKAMSVSRRWVFICLNQPMGAAHVVAATPPSGAGRLGAVRLAGVRRHAIASALLGVIQHRIGALQHALHGFFRL